MPFVEEITPRVFGQPRLTPFAPDPVQRDQALYPVATPAPEQVKAPTIDKTFEAAFGLENDVLAAADLLSQPTHQPDSEYRLGQDLKDRGLWDARDEFIQSQSREETDFLVQKREQELAYKRTLMASGAPGIVAAMLAGVLSPTLLVPFASGQKGMKLVGTAIAYNAAAQGAQEAVLQEARMTRTAEESAIAIGTGTIITGILGGAIAAAGNKGVQELASALERDISQGFSLRTQRGMGAQATMELTDAGTFKPFPGLRIGKEIGPVTRGIEQDFSPLGRTITSNFSTAGLVQKGNMGGISGNLGGSLEHVIYLHQRTVADAVTAMDDAWADFVYNGAPPVFARNIRAELRGLRGGRMTKEEFKEQVGRALIDAETDVVPQARKVAEAYNATFTSYGKMAEQLGLLKMLSPEEMGDASYFMRAYDDAKIEARMQDFAEMVAEHFNADMQSQFMKRVASLETREARIAEAEKIAKLPKEEVEKMETQLRYEQKKMEAAAPGELRAYNEARKAGDKEGARKIFDASPVIQDFMKNKRFIQQRLKLLSRSDSVAAERIGKAIERLDTIRQQQFATIQRIVARTDALSAKLEKIAPEKIGEELSAVAKRLDDEIERLKKLNKAIQKEAVNSEELSMKAVLLSVRADKSNARLEKLQQRLAAIGEKDDEGARAELRALIEETKVAGLDSIERRARARDAMVERAKKKSPAALEAQRIEKRERLKIARQELADSTRIAGGEDIDLAGKKVNFTKHALDRANEVTREILGINNRIQGYEMLHMEGRGPELARVLRIPNSFVSSKGVAMADFIEMDAEKVMRKYIRTLGADIEITRRFGDPNMKQTLANLYQEQTEANAKLKEKFGADPAKYEKEQKKLSEAYRALHRDIDVLLERARGIRGVPKRPDAFTTRAGRFMLNLNTSRMMGKVLVSSIPDLGRPIMKHGLTRALRDGFVPFIANTKRMQLSRKEAHLAALGLDPIIHSRAYQFADLLDEYGRTSKVERGVEFIATKTGLIGAFDYWNKAMKEISASVALVRFSDALGIVAGGAKATDKEVLKATELLAAHGIDPKLATKIWDEFLSPGGADEIDGVLIPNTEMWKDAGAVRSFRAALAHNVNDTIITPGMERPSWMDDTLGGRLIGQFKSFGMASSSKTLMAGVQQHDMAVLQGAGISLALGALSYYLWAVATGGRAYEEMLTAGPDKWADEAVSRSGLLAALGDAQKILSEIPMGRDAEGKTVSYATFSKRPLTRYAGAGLVDALMGPSFDAVSKAAAILTGLHEPTDATLHALRLLTPLQNVIGLSRAFDAVEKVGASYLPDRRNQ